MIESTQAFQTSIVGKARRIYIRAVIDISDPDMVFLEPVSSGAAPWSRAEQLHDKNMDTPTRYATLERNRWLLDGTFGLIPDDDQINGNVGYVLDELSGEDGTFSTEQYIQQPFENVSILQAFSLYFSKDEADGVAKDFKVEVLYGDTAYFTQEVAGNTAKSVSFDGFTVYDPTSIKVTVTKWSLPGRRCRFMEIIPGVYEEWSDRMFASFDATLQGNFSCLTLPYGTVNLSVNNVSKRFEPRSKNGIFQSIEERQGMEVYIGVRLEDGTVEYKKLGVFYQSGDGWKTGDNGVSIAWSLVDVIGLLTERTFIVPSTLPTTLQGWIAALVAQLGDNFKDRYHVDPDYASLSVTANSADDVTGKSCGDILRWACMATGTWPRADAETGYLTAEPLWNQGNKVLLRNLVNYPTMKANESLAALVFQLSDGTEEVISGNATASEKTVTIQNPFIHTSAQALAAARLILSCYGGNVIETTGRGDPSSEIGDVDTIWLDESQATTARRMSQTFTMQNGVLQGCASKLLQADGSYLFTEYAVITESGTWTAPAGVTQLRIVLGAGGQGGSRGGDGWIGKTGNLGTGLGAGYGEQGLDGVGGKVWYGVINCNEQQEFEVHLGAGGAASGTYGVPGAMGGETTFGVYSSENGQLYANGYTDIANGQSFARTGVAVPLPGTGDGGKGGDGGEPGQGYLKEVQHRPNPAKPEVVNTRLELVVTKEPGPGKPGVAGATGFVMVTWDKPEA